MPIHHALLGKRPATTERGGRSDRVPRRPGRVPLRGRTAPPPHNA